MNIGWRFPPLSGGSKQGYTNNDIEVFKGEELIDNLAREICQNSLDAHDGGQEPVKVVFELKSIVKAQHAVFSGYEQCLEGCRRFWDNGKIDSKLQKFLAEANRTISQPTISVLVASDYHTKGLLGNRDLNDISSPWEALTGADGLSVKPDDNSGGSFGIGKNAPFACSALSMVFYNTFDLDDNKAFIGVSRLATLLNDDNKPTQRVGRYQNNDDANEKWLPLYESDGDSFKDLFERTEHGTDIIVVGFSETENWQEKVAKAVIKNFFVAIGERKLIVEIKDGDEGFLIDSAHICELIENLAKDDSRCDVTRQLNLAYTNPDWHGKLDVLGESEAVEIYIKADSSFGRTISNFRSTGMLVGQYQRRFFQHYAAVVVVRGKELGRILREAEPPRHNRWDHTLIMGEENKEDRKKAKVAIDFLNSELARIIKEQYEIPAGDQDDAVGVSEYLPDIEEGAISEQSVGTDILKVKVKIGKAKVKKSKPNEEYVPGVNAMGDPISGETGGKGGRIGPRPVGPEPYPGPGPGPVPGPNPGNGPDSVVVPGKKGVSGATEGHGDRVISKKELQQRRIYPVSEKNGLYRIIIKSAKDYEKLYVKCAAVGEGGDMDYLKIVKFMYKGKSVSVNNGKAGPITLVKGEVAEFMVTFEEKEKMGLNLFLFEGV